MNWNTKFKWYRFNVVRKIRNLEGDDLVNELESVIEDIKSKKLDKNGLFELYIKQLEAVIQETKRRPKKKSRQFDPFYIPKSGDGRIVLFGLSNAGKSTLMNAITNTDVKTGDYLHTTREALAGSLEYEDLKIQIIDLPGFLDFKEDWVISRQIVRVARTSDAILLVIDLSMDIKRQYKFLIDQLRNAKLMENENESSSIYKLGIIATKGDLPGSKKNYELLRSITSIPMIPITINRPDSLNALKTYLYETLDVIRIYTKPPRGDLAKIPFICPSGTTIYQLAGKIHKGFLKNFRYAKIWGNSVEFPGKRVGFAHEVVDKDIVEITLNRG
ncbi:MAG: GTPase [Candidatus Hodarchaeales archaeon]